MKNFSEKPWKEAIVEIPGIPERGGEVAMQKVWVMKEGDKFILESHSLQDGLIALEKIEREGLPDFGLESGAGLINLDTRHIDDSRVEIRVFNPKGRGYPSRVQRLDSEFDGEGRGHVSQ